MFWDYCGHAAVQLWVNEIRASGVDAAAAADDDDDDNTVEEAHSAGDAEDAEDHDRI